MIKIEKIRTIEGPDPIRVRVITDINGNIWFVAKDVAQAMGFKRTRDAICHRIPKEYRESVQLPQPGRGSRRHTVLDVRGVYAFASHDFRLKGQCREFLGWFTWALLPDVLDRLGDYWWRGLRVGINALVSNLGAQYRALEKALDRQLASNFRSLFEAEARAKNAEKRLAEVLGALQSLVGQRESK